MNSIQKLNCLIILLFVGVFNSGCVKFDPVNASGLDKKPDIFPDYKDITIPPNIAPMNFHMIEKGKFIIIASSELEEYQIILNSSNGIVQFPEKKWKKLLKKSTKNKIEIQVYAQDRKNGQTIKYKPFYFYVTKENIDSHLVYRMLYPGYHNWSEIQILQRSLENFYEAPIIVNSLLEKNCINCHSFNGNNPNSFLVHIRGSKGGTYFVDDNSIYRKDLKTEQMFGGATYPSWHPDGNFIAFSSNRVKQQFYAHASKTTEVYDQASTLVLFDKQNNEMSPIIRNDSIEHLYTFPSWSPDGNYLYFCVAKKDFKNLDLNMNDIKKTHYNLARKSFNKKNKSFGRTEIIFDAKTKNKSVSFPRISPNGNYLAFTLSDYGTFPIWHKEADLYLLNLTNNNTKKMNLNSNETESYHAWSSNGKWLVFSSKRQDGLSARPFFAYIRSNGTEGKPFVLPQKDPKYYHQLLKTFNIPELVTGKIDVNTRDFSKASKELPVKATMNKSELPLGWKENKKVKETPAYQLGVHQ